LKRGPVNELLRTYNEMFGPTASQPTYSGEN
jgi:hypothetical protein